MIIMSEDQAVIYLLCGVMAVRALTSKQKFSYEIFQGYEIINQTFLKVEKILMFILPLIVMMLNTLFDFHSFVIRFWMILILLLDFALQYFAKSMGWMKDSPKTKVCYLLIMWIIFMIAIFFTIK